MLIYFTVAPKEEDHSSCVDRADLSVYIRDPEFKYKDFARRGEVSKIPTFRVQVWNI